MTSQRKAYRASILHSIADPKDVGLENSYEFFEDGMIVVEHGHIIDIGSATDVLARHPKPLKVTTYKDKLITSGFIDTHIHYPQTGMIASYGEQLLDWLENYTFPEERRFKNPVYAHKVAKLFLDELASNGTTTALVFGTVHKESVDVFFEEAEKRKLRMIAGKVLMDRNAPDYLTDTPESGYQASKELIEKWHNRGRLLYAVTPRFAPTSTPEQLATVGKLLEEYPDVYMHTHLSENKKEIEWVLDLFPERESYLDVYDHYGLLHKRSVFAHGIHLSDCECQRLADTESAIAFCPTSNLFLGSGLFKLNKLEEHGVRVGMGTDVGAGTSFSILQTMSEAYKIMQLQQEKLHPLKSLYLATLGGAKSLHLEDKIGNLAVGKEADFVVLDLHATQLMRFRMKQATTLEEKLFVLMSLGDDRTVCETYIFGDKAYDVQGERDKRLVS
ncbi:MULTISPECIES: guanine deaminase [Vibrio]|uniref:Guanine deaminase n=1 Tax=Vibrio mediterranei TaxID=689 RepID=A0ABX5D9A9_9VIBR|nr:MULTISPECIES: guanine deaminase [Vibrio]EDL54366.1 guanine deaminase [Vibrio mediterranei AK1]MCF4176483.1 guanine deaminase [Vibrio sp. McD22-P3]MCG9664865.1 guanine deaminase [Vibrio mediterranei]NOH26873.1 guanine deaminase [Vibrio mediterranei]NUW72244.1 guanine deaminase [Vibrio mediterranei]